MKARDFIPYYGLQVMLQFKETIARATRAGEALNVPVFSDRGRPTNAHGNEVSPDSKEIAAQRTWPVGPATGGDQKYVFTYVLESAVVFPNEDGDLLVVSYREGDALIELCVDPELIIACSTVRGQTESPLIKA